MDSGYVGGGAAMVRCCSKYGGGEGAAQPGSLSTQFRAVLTSTQGLLLAIYTSGAQPASKEGWSGGGGLAKLGGQLRKCLLRNDIREGKTWWKQKVREPVARGCGLSFPLDQLRAQSQDTPHVSSLQFPSNPSAARSPQQ